MNQSLSAMLPPRAPGAEANLIYVLRYDDSEDVKVVKSEAPIIPRSEHYHEEALRIMGEHDPFNCEICAGFMHDGRDLRLVVTAQSLRRYVRGPG